MSHMFIGRKRERVLITIGPCSDNNNRLLLLEPWFSLTSKRESQRVLISARGDSL